MSKILVVTREAAEKAWMKSLLHPLKENQKVVVHKDQEDVSEGFIRVKHGAGQVSVFHERVFNEFKK